MNSLDVSEVSPFLIMPDELIVEICEKMQLTELLKLSTASSTVYHVCSEVIAKRKASRLLFSFKQLLEYLTNHVSDRLRQEDRMDLALMIVEIFRNIGKRFNNQIVVNKNNVYINDNFNIINLDIDDITELYTPIYEFLDSRGYDEYETGLINIYIDLDMLERIFSPIVIAQNIRFEGIEEGFIFRLPD